MTWLCRTGVQSKCWMLVCFVPVPCHSSQATLPWEIVPAFRKCMNEQGMTKKMWLILASYLLLISNTFYSNSLSRYWLCFLTPRAFLDSSYVVSCPEYLSPWISGLLLYTNLGSCSFFQDLNDIVNEIIMWERIKMHDKLGNSTMNTNHGRLFHFLLW